MTAPPELCVLLDGEAVGRLRRDRRGRLSFAYDRHYAQAPTRGPLSLSMPVGAEPYGDEPASRWVASLLPDRPETLARWRSAHGAVDAFELLATPVGHDCAGAVQFCRLDRLDEVRERPGRLLTDQEMGRRVAALARGSTDWDIDDVEPCYSLSGFQHKMALRRFGRRWALPQGASPSTHILKPRHRDAGGPAVVEHLCADAARIAGLDAAATTVEFYDEHPVTVVERFDRTSDASGRRRIHQEDMCQALGRDGQKRHEHTGGPGMAQIADLLRSHSHDPDTDVRKFADGLLWALVTVNRDAHARNYSVMLAGTVRLAPLYDLQSSLPYADPKLGKREMAMRYGSGFTVYNSNSDHSLIDTAARLRLPAGWVIGRAEALAGQAVEAFTTAVERLPPAAHGHLAAEELLDRLSRRCDSVAKTAAANRRRLPGRSAKKASTVTVEPLTPKTTGRARRYRRPEIEAALAASPNATYAEIARVCGVSSSYVGRIARSVRLQRRR